MSATDDSLILQIIDTREPQALMATLIQPVLLKNWEEPEEDESIHPEETDDTDENPTPAWFLQCCVADHVEEFKESDLVKKKFNGYESVIAHPVFLWSPGEEITYCFLPGRYSGTPNQREVVSKAMREWTRYSNVKFRQIFNVQDSMVRITFNPKDGNWSRLGTSALRVLKTAVTANFCDVSEDTAPSAHQLGVVLHEIGHMLGLKHEHQSPSVKGILTWIDTEVKSYFKKKCKWSDTMTTEQVLTTEDVSHLSNYTHLDLKSIMMYPMPSTTNITASGTKGITIPSNDTLSVYDKAFIAIHYPYLNGNPHAADWNFERALREIRLGDMVHDIVMQKFRQGDWKGIRDNLPEWYFHERARMNLVAMESLQ